MLDRNSVLAEAGADLAHTQALPRSVMAGEHCVAGRPLLAPWRQQEVHPVAAALCAAGTWRRFSARPVPDSDAGGRQSRALPRPTHGGEPCTARRSPRPPRDPGEGRPRSHVHTRSPPTRATGCRQQNRHGYRRASRTNAIRADSVGSRRQGAPHAVIMRLARAPRVVTLVSGTATHSAPAVAVT